MSNLADLMKCPECLIEGRFEIVIRKKTIEAECENCGFRIDDRLPYPKHRYDEDGHMYPFNVGDVRPRWTRKEDDVTCSQKQWDEKHK